MPYINQHDRQCVDQEITDLVFEMREVSGGTCPVQSGLANYVISRIIAQAMMPASGWSYSSLSKALAVFRDAEAEMRRRLLDTYEDKMIQKNGDIPEYENY